MLQALQARHRRRRQPGRQAAAQLPQHRSPLDSAPPQVGSIGGWVRGDLARRLGVFGGAPDHSRRCKLAWVFLGAWAGAGHVVSARNVVSTAFRLLLLYARNASQALRS